MNTKDKWTNEALDDNMDVVENGTIHCGRE
jgi:hypothetical protein